MFNSEIKSFRWTFLAFQLYGTFCLACSFCSTKNLPPPASNSATQAQPTAPQANPSGGIVIQGGIGKAAGDSFINGYLDSVGKDYAVDSDRSPSNRNQEESDITVTDTSEVYGN